MPMDDLEYEDENECGLVEIKKDNGRYSINTDCHYTFAERLEIRERYKRVESQLLKGINVGTDIFFWKFSAPELLVWADLKFYGLLLYPQYPIKNYFVDFAHPFKRIAIEIDSERWHPDKEKDLLRQREIESEGFRVIRITAKDVLTNNPFPQINDLIKLIHG